MSLESQDSREVEHDRRMGQGGFDRESSPSSNIIERFIGSILNDPRRPGARMMSGSPFGRSPFGSSPFGRGGPSLSDIFDDEDINEIFGEGTLEVMEVGPDGPHRIGSVDAKASDVLALMEGRDRLGLADMLKNHIENPPSRGQRKLSMLSMLEPMMPLTMKLHMYAGPAGAEIARFLKSPDGEHDFAITAHLAKVMAAARAADKEKFANLGKRLKTYAFDLDGLINKIQLFVDKRTVSTARSVQMRLASVAPLALALLEDVHQDVKQHEADAVELLRRTRQI